MTNGRENDEKAYKCTRKILDKALYLIGKTLPLIHL